VGWKPESCAVLKIVAFVSVIHQKKITRFGGFFRAAIYYSAVPSLPALPASEKCKKNDDKIFPK